MIARSGRCRRAWRGACARSSKAYLADLDGFELFIRYCAICHGDAGRGAENLATTKSKPTVLDAEYFAHHDATHVANAVWHMMGEKKPQ